MALVFSKLFTSILWKDLLWPQGSSFGFDIHICVWNNHIVSSEMQKPKLGLGVYHLTSVNSGRASFKFVRLWMVYDKILINKKIRKEPGRNSFERTSQMQFHNVQLLNRLMACLSNGQCPTIQLSNCPTVQLSNCPTVQLSNSPWWTATIKRCRLTSSPCCSACPPHCRDWRGGPGQQIGWTTGSCPGPSPVAARRQTGRRLSGAQQADTAAEVAGQTTPFLPLLHLHVKDVAIKKLVGRIRK